jgi:predicted DNA-binding transcriptional regulator YafY
LTGLEEAEVRALFMASMPSALAELGFGAELKTALLKLLAALPDERRHEEQWVRARVYLDWESWRADARSYAGPELLPVVRQAVWEDRRLWIVYRRESSFYRREFERLVEPYGLVAKEGEWRLVCGDAPEAGSEAGSDQRIRVFRIGELAGARITTHTFVRPRNFDLPGFWRTWCAQAQGLRRQYHVSARISPQLAVDLPLYLGEHLRTVQRGESNQAIAGMGDTWLSIELLFDSLEEARTKLLGLGAGVEVMTPVALRRSLLDYAEQVVKHYSRH